MITKTRTIYVKRKTGFLSYVHDPTGCRSILARPFPKGLSAERSQQDAFAQSRGGRRYSNSRADFVRSFSQDPTILAFANQFCNGPSDEDHVDDVGSAVARQDEDEEASFASFCTAVLYECLTREKPEMVKTYLSLYETLHSLERAAAAAAAGANDNNEGKASRGSNTLSRFAPLSLLLENVKLILTFYDHRMSPSRSTNTNNKVDDDDDEKKKKMQASSSSSSSLLSSSSSSSSDDGGRLIQASFLLSLKNRLHSIFARCNLQDALKEYVLAQQQQQWQQGSHLLLPATIAKDPSLRALFACYVAFYNVPHPVHLLMRRPGIGGKISFVDLAIRFPDVPPALLSVIHNILASRP